MKVKAGRALAKPHFDFQRLGVSLEKQTADLRRLSWKAAVYYRFFMRASKFQKQKRFQAFKEQA